MSLLSDKPKEPIDLGLLEDDDEFEEFPEENWTPKDQDNKDISVWEDNWDDDNVEDDFSKQLKQELAKPLPDDKKKRSNSEVAADLRARETRAMQAQQEVRDDDRKRSTRK